MNEEITFNNTVFPVSLETDRLVLRKMTADDVDDLFAIGSDPETSYWAGMAPMETPDEAHDYIYMGNCFAEEVQYGITEQGLNRVVGVLDTTKEYMNGKPVYFIGYFLSKEVEGRGYMTESLRELCDEIFLCTDVNTIMLEIRPDNAASRAVARHCGFVQNANQKEWRLNLYDKPLDEFILTRESFYYGEVI